MSWSWHPKRPDCAGLDAHKDTLVAGVLGIALHTLGTLGKAVLGHHGER